MFRFLSIVLVWQFALVAVAQEKTDLKDRPIAIRDSNVILRGSLQNARLRFRDKHRGHVAFIGGSITEMNGYRPMVMSILKERFPETAFTFTDAGISSTCSTTGAFRLRDHVLRHGPVDLLFVEFAVNDDQDAGHSMQRAVRGMEGIIRHVRQHNPRSDIVITYFVNPGMLAKLQQGQVPTSIAAHHRVAERYRIPEIHLARQVAESITAGDLTWQLFGGTHPKPYGNRIAADMIDRLMQRAWDDRGEVSDPRDDDLPTPLDPLSYERGRWIEVHNARLDGATIGVPDWKSIRGSKRNRFTSRKLLTIDKPDALVSLDFTGTAIGVYVVAGPDAARVEASVDESDWVTVDLYHRFSKGLHYPRTVMFADDLENSKHTLRLRLANEQSEGRGAARILAFAAN